MILESDVDRVVDLVRKYSSEKLGSSDRYMTIGADDAFAVWGLDSIDLVCISALVEDRFDCQIDPTTFLKVNTVRLAMKILIRDQDCVADQDCGVA